MRYAASLNIQSRRVNVEHVEQVVDAHLIQCPLDERRVHALRVFVAVFLYLVHQEVVELLEDVGRHVPVEILVAVGEEVEDVLAVLLAHAVEVVGHDEAPHPELIEVGDKLALVLQRERTHTVVVDLKLAADARSMCLVIKILCFQRVSLARKTHVKIVKLVIHGKIIFLKRKNTKKTPCVDFFYNFTR